MVQGHGTNSTTGLVKSITQTGGNFTYTYDDNGNIVSVVQDGKKTAYTYDALGQLTQVDDQQENATWVYTYDQGGNILSKKKYAYGVTTGEPTESKTFTYGNAKWKDQLTAVDGVNITYDAIGNPLNDGTWTYTWQNGRQLASMSKGGTTASFKYNENGMRVQKTVNGIVTDYTLHGNNVVHLKQGGDNLHFFYDANNTPAVVVYNGTPYIYAKNLQGDIVAILNSAGTAVVCYTYDAWGRPISCTGSMSTTLGTVQPFRYRGYVYDEEAELFYLENRYYMLSINRFINADRYVATSENLFACNMFSYCENLPVTQLDPAGTASIALFQHTHDNHICISEISDSDDEDIPNVVLYKPHTNNARPSTQNKHEEGESRKKRDAHGEKGDNRRKQDRSNKRNNNTSKFEIFCLSILLLGAIIYIAGNDITGVGVADDAALAPTGAMLLNNIGLLFR